MVFCGGPVEFDEVKVKPFNWFRMSENLRSLFLEMIDGNVKGCILSTDNGGWMNCKKYLKMAVQSCAHRSI